MWFGTIEQFYDKQKKIKFCGNSMSNTENNYSGNLIIRIVREWIKSLN